MKFLAMNHQPQTPAQTQAQLRSFATFALFALFLVAAPAFAQGLDSVNSFLDTVVGLLKGAGVLIVTVAIMWCGYKMIFKGASFSEVAMIFVGGLLIGGAATIAGYLIPA